MTPEQRKWLERLERLLGMSLPSAPVKAGAPGPEGDAALEVLDRPAAVVPALSGDALTGDAADQALPKLQSTVTFFNFTGSDLKLLQSNLKFNTARFVPAVPPVVPARDKVTFRVVETTLGAARTAGSAKYHVDQRRHNTDVTFSWAGDHADVRVDGDGPFQGQARGVEDSDAGNEYELNIREPSTPPEDEALQVRIDVTNHSGFDMTLVSATLEDPAHSEFALKPTAQINNKKTRTFRVQALDEAHPEAAGNAVYRVGRPDKPHSAIMSWRKEATPVGTMNPNDGDFIINAGKREDGFTFEVLPHSGPLPPPPGPTKVTIVNTASFIMKQDLLLLDGKKAQFKSKPADTIDGGRKTQFEVESTDPQFPETDGIVAYAFRVTGEADQNEHIVNMTWRSKDKSFAKIAPPSDGVTVDVSGTSTDVVFTVTGPQLDFNPPAKTRQPTLREGDKSADGWVEYLQEALNHHNNAGLTVDGDFGGDTKKAVVAFQTKHKREGCMVDGVVGDQTWSFLREGIPEKPHTDGRKPHTFVQKGVEARWVREKEVCRFDSGQDALVMEAVSVGDTDFMQNQVARIRVTNPDGVKKILEHPLGPPIRESTTGQGSTHQVKVEQFSTLFDEKATKAPPGSYTVEAFFEKEIGGDSFSDVVVIPAD
jgi:hypothetical protein